MLRLLQIENIALIKSAEIEFCEGFSVLTGETGAGKSIIIDSLSLLLGSRAPRELIRTGEERATVTALFEDIDGECAGLLSEYGIDCEDSTLLLSRTVSTDGKSSARINGRTVTQSMLREVCRTLLCIHGQHDNRVLMQKESHIRLLDAYAGLAGKFGEYAVVYNELRALQRELEKLRLDEAEKIRLRDMLVYQINEISSAKLKPGEEEELMSERLRLQNAERIKKQTGFAYRALYGSERGSVVLLLDRSAAALGQITDAIPEAGELAAKLEHFRYEIEDIAETVRGLSEYGEGDPTVRLDKIEGRLEILSRLKRKYGADIAGILRFKEEAESRLAELDSAEERIAELTEQARALESEARKLAGEISAERIKNAAKAAKEICDELKFLDMPGVRFEIKVTPAGELRPVGADYVEFLISANPGEPPMPLSKIASGGELSRVMLALLSVLASNDGIPTMIFDEIDAGISGKTSRKVGIRLKGLSKDTQVFCVTHSAQIASLADRHYLVSKSEVDRRTETAVRLLDEEGRVAEIARILGGINITEKQREAAREMIEEGKNL
ncbi:MAG: DNA repair protein RecN [Eubacteriales bacterium]|jgi:DNA repair protein RecN (Recombination protein N)